MQITAVLPAVFFTDEALASMQGQSVPFSFAGVTVGQVTIESVRQNTLGPELSCAMTFGATGSMIPVPPKLLASIDVSLHRSEHPDGDGAYDEVVVHRMVYPADRADTPE